MQIMGVSSSSSSMAVVACAARAIGVVDVESPELTMTVRPEHSE